MMGVLMMNAHVGRAGVVPGRACVMTGKPGMRSQAGSAAASCLDRR